MSPRQNLKVWVDGVALPEDQARALWQRFSAWMDEHPADLAGFARSEGFMSVHPEMDGASPALIASHTTPQGPYGPAPRRGAPARTKRGRR